MTMANYYDAEDRLKPDDFANVHGHSTDPGNDQHDGWKPFRTRRNPQIPRRWCPSCHFLGWIASGAITIFLVAFQRFAEVSYPVIPEDQIYHILEPSFDYSNNEPKTNLLKSNHKPLCQVNMTRLGEYKLGMENPSPLPPFAVDAGGLWAPSICRPLYQVVLVIPYRDRAEHLSKFLKIMHPFLQHQLLDYKIVVVEQTHVKAFNRAKLFNVGFLESKALHGHTHCLVFHDVDLIPLDGRNLYACASEPRHLSSNLDEFRFNLPYIDLFGGAVAMTTEVFEEANGFSNKYYGWGGEDDDFRQNRIPSRPLIRLEPHIARYTGLKHIKAQPSPDRFKLLKSGGETDLSPAAVSAEGGDSIDTKEATAPSTASAGQDGLSDIKYKVIEKQLKPLYTHIVVDL